MNNIVKAQIALTLTLKSDLHIGSGEYSSSSTSEESAECATSNIVLTNNEKPCIPATSFKGALARHVIDINFNERYFGISQVTDKKSNGACSFNNAFITNDNYHTAERTQVAIDATTGAASEHQLFSKNWLKAGVTFTTTILLEHITEAELENFIAFIESTSISMGAHQSVGAGELSIDISSVSYLDRASLSKWLINDDDLACYFQEYSWNKNDALTGNGALKVALLPQSPFMVNDPVRVKEHKQNKNVDKAFAQYTHLNYKGASTIPGTSIKGVLRAHFIKILNSFGYEQTASIVEENFGSERQKANIKVTAATAQDHMPHLQTMIAIDRFTGGVAHGALIQLEAAYPNLLALELTINPKKLTDISKLVWLYLIKDMSQQQLTFGAHSAIGYGEFAIAIAQEEEFVSKFEDIYSLLLNYLDISKQELEQAQQKLQGVAA